LFQLFIVYFNWLVSANLRAAVLFAASFNGKTRLADGFGMRKQIAKVFCICVKIMKRLHLSNFIESILAKRIHLANAREFRCGIVRQTGSEHRVGRRLYANSRLFRDRGKLRRRGSF
jgi:hypothetical protein